METLSWELMKEHISSANPSVLPMGGSREVLIGFAPDTSRLFLRLPLEADAKVPPSPYVELKVEPRVDGGKRVLEVYTQTAHLFQEFHRFAGLMTEEFEHAKQTAVNAFLVVVKRWRELTTKRDILTEEEQLGLMGELVVLEALIRRNGVTAIESWTGRAEKPERHDFRIENIDIEVKATRSSQRNHIIHGLRQLEPSGGHRLFVVSLRFEAAGMNNGRSLAEYIQVVRNGVASSRDKSDQFEEKLLAARYRNDDAAHYQERLILADEPIAIAVDDNIPRLDTSVIQNAIGPSLASRIDNDVTYRINVEGLGVPLANSSLTGLFAPISTESL